MVRPIFAVAATAFVVLFVGCGQSGSETKTDTALLDEVKRVEQTQVALAEDENRATIEKLEKSIARMRSAIDAKAAEAVAVALVVAEGAGPASAPAPPIEPRLRERAGNAQQLHDADQAHEKAKRAFLQRHPGILERTRARLERDRAAETSKELDEAVGGPGVGKR